MFRSPPIVFANCVLDLGEHADGCVFGDWRCAKAMGISLLESRSNTFLQHAKDEPVSNESSLDMDNSDFQTEGSQSHDGAVNPGLKRCRSDNSSSRGKFCIRTLLTIAHQFYRKEGSIIMNPGLISQNMLTD